MSVDDDVAARSRSTPSRRQALLLPGLPACSPPASRSRAASPDGPTSGAPSPAGPTADASSPVTVSSPEPVAAGAGGGVLNIVAHPDDDLLFLSPALLTSVRSGRPVRTVFLTAGDDGQGPAYWLGREAGIRSAYARMAGVGDAWHPVPTSQLAPASVLTGAAQVSVQFFRLPDGGPGHGFARAGWQSLPQVWRGQEATIRAVDGSAGYTRDGLVQALVSVMADVRAATVRTQDFHGRFGDGDHNDHHAAAYLARAASQRFAGPHWLESYQDYSTSGRRVDVPAGQLREKEAAFGAYAVHDRLVCTGGTSACGRSFTSWERRQYRESRTWSR